MTRVMLVTLALATIAPSVVYGWENEYTTTVYVYGTSTVTAVITGQPATTTVNNGGGYGAQTTSTTTTTTYVYNGYNGNGGQRQSTSSPYQLSNYPQTPGPEDTASPTGDYRTQYPGYPGGPPLQGPSLTSAIPSTTRTFPSGQYPNGQMTTTTQTQTYPSQYRQNGAPAQCVPTSSPRPTSTQPSGYTQMMLKIIDDLNNLLRGVSQYLPSNMQTCADSSSHWPDGLRGGNRQAPASTSSGYLFTGYATATGSAYGLAGTPVVGAGADAGALQGIANFISTSPATGEVPEEDVIALLDQTVQTPLLAGLAAESYERFQETRGWIRAGRRIELAAQGIVIKREEMERLEREYEAVVEMKKLSKERRNGKQGRPALGKRQQYQGDGTQCMACNSTAQSQAACTIMALAFQVRSEYAYYQSLDRTSFEAYSTTIQSSFYNARQNILAGLPNNNTATALYNDATGIWTEIVQRQYDGNFYRNAGSTARERRAKRQFVTGTNTYVVTATATVYCAGYGTGAAAQSLLPAQMLFVLASAVLAALGGMWVL